MRWISRESIETVGRWPSFWWRRVGITGMAVAGLGFGVISAGAAEGGWKVTAGFMGGILGLCFGGGSALGMYLLLTHWVRSHEAHRQTRAFVNIRPLAGPLPVDLGGWAADPVLADEVLRAIVRRELGLVVECGSGWTTVLVARCLEELGKGRIVAFEHQANFVEWTQRLLTRYGGSERATLVHAPIVEREVDEKVCRWYGSEADDAVQERIDLLLVDGPPGNLFSECRFPAIPLLEDRLAPDAMILLDDGRRQDEARIATRWERRLGVDARFVDTAKGLWVFELDG